jgi:signal transduction histidine kinase
MKASHALKTHKMSNINCTHIDRQRIFVVVALAIFITVLHFWTEYTKTYQHIIFRESYFLPLILGGFWFGLRGALITSLSITILYFFYTVYSWQGFSIEDFNNIVEMILFNVIAAVIGLLRNSERNREKEKIEEIAALAGGLAHEMNTPLFTAIGTLQLVQDEIESQNPIFRDLQITLKNLKQIKYLVKKIAAIRQVEMKAYVNDTLIIDFEKSEFYSQNHTSL